MFQYKPLNRSQRASRLVVLQLGSEGDDIECSIIEPLLLESFETILKYEALSYVWGDSTDTQDIQVEGEPFPVGKNLYSALLHLRHEDKVRLLWVDAICINQADILERNWQVSFMGLIYRSAEQVVVWLGDSNFGSNLIFSLLLVYEIVKEGKGDEVKPELRNFAACVFGEEAKPANFTGMEGFERAWRDFDELVQRPLFSRAWVVQEIVLAQKVLVHCGYHHASWDILCEAHAWASGLQTLAAEAGGFSTLMNESRNFWEIASLRRDLRLPESKANPSETLVMLASRFGWLNATDPRDKLYACLGISRQIIETGKLLDHGFYPDYEKPVLQVYKEFALFCIQKYQTLDVFCVGHALDPDRSYRFRLRDWPSWVPDWQIRGTQTLGPQFKSLTGLTNHIPRDFRASGDTTIYVREMQGVENILSVQGFVFDTVIDVTKDWFQDPKAISSWDMKWLKWHALYEEDPPGADPYGSEDAREEAYWRTLVADSNGEGGKAPDEFGDCFRIWRYWDSHYGVKPGGLPTNKLWISNFDFTQLPEPAEMEKAYDAFLEQMFATVRGRKLFKTERGYIGLGSWAVQPGWSVCILHGGNFPMLAQPTGALMIKSSGQSETAQFKAHSKGSGDVESCKLEELSLSENTGVANREEQRTNDTSDMNDKVQNSENWTSLEEPGGTNRERSVAKETLESERDAETSNIEEPDSAEPTKVTYFTFLGTADCYVHGIMDGEALETAKVEGLKVGHIFFE